jgi:hypothetical protein
MAINRFFIDAILIGSSTLLLLMDGVCCAAIVRKVLSTLS